MQGTHRIRWVRPEFMLIGTVLSWDRDGDTPIADLHT
jgi:hypothetical protein